MHSTLLKPGEFSPRPHAPSSEERSEISRQRTHAAQAAPAAPEETPPAPLSGVRLKEPGRRPARWLRDGETPSGTGSLQADCLTGCYEALKGYLPLVYKMVQQLSRRLPANVERDDLLAAGVFGLVDSIRKNGGSDGETFAGYARMRVRGAILDELRAQDWLSRRAREAWAAEAGERWATSFVSLSEVTPIEESIHLSGDDDPTEALDARSVQRALSEAIEQLPERERRIVGMYYFEGAKLKEIGAELGVSEPRVSQLHTRALGRLRGMLDSAS